MNGLELQRECLYADPTYSAYYYRFFSVRRSDHTIPPVEAITQDVLLELERLERAWVATT
jgi:hypothetical protein